MVLTLSSRSESQHGLLADKPTTSTCRFGCQPEVKQLGAWLMTAKRSTDIKGSRGSSALQSYLTSVLAYKVASMVAKAGTPPEHTSQFPEQKAAPNRSPRASAIILRRHVPIACKTCEDTQAIIGHQHRVAPLSDTNRSTLWSRDSVKHMASRAPSLPQQLRLIMNSSEAEPIHIQGANTPRIPSMDIQISGCPKIPPLFRNLAMLAKWLTSSTTSGVSTAQCALPL